MTTLDDCKHNSAMHAQWPAIIRQHLFHEVSGPWAQHSSRALHSTTLSTCYPSTVLLAPCTAHTMAGCLQTPAGSAWSGNTRPTLKAHCTGYLQLRFPATTPVADPLQTCWAEQVSLGCTAGRWVMVVQAAWVTKQKQRHLNNSSVSSIPWLCNRAHPWWYIRNLDMQAGQGKQVWWWDLTIFSVHVTLTYAHYVQPYCTRRVVYSYLLVINCGWTWSCHVH